MVVGGAASGIALQSRALVSLRVACSCHRHTFWSVLPIRRLAFPPRLPPPSNPSPSPGGQ
eukprot:11473339-Alexandrium_andersonii.AAC.1